MTLTRSQVLAELRYWRRVLGIGAEWRIDVTLADPDEADDDLRSSQAYISVESGYKAASLVVRAHRIKDGELPIVIAHELLHVVTAPAANIVRQALADRFADHANDVIEGCVEQLARAFVGMDRRRARRTGRGAVKAARR